MCFSTTVTKGGLPLETVTQWIDFNKFPVVFDFICSEATSGDAWTAYSKQLSPQDLQVNLHSIQRDDFCVFSYLKKINNFFRFLNQLSRLLTQES